MSDNNAKNDPIIKEFTEKEMDIIRQMEEEYSEDIELIIRKKNSGDYEFNIKFSDQSPGEVARCLKEIEEAGARNIISLCLMKLKDRDPEVFNRIVKIYLRMIDKEEKRNSVQEIMRPSQVFNRG